MPPTLPRPPLFAVLALTFNALVWGLSWWPFRLLNEQGLHPLWSTVAIYLTAAAIVAAVRPRALAEVVRTPSLWLLALAAGSTNAAFNWGVSIGDVVRVVLLFYLMPLWTVLLAWLLLGEKPTLDVLLRVLLALAGALIVLWPPSTAGAAMPLPDSLADGLGVAGGAAFALTNVLLRREALRSEGGRAVAMFAGCVVVAGSLAAVLTAQGRIGGPLLPSAGWLLFTFGLGGLFLLSSMALQYGAARLSANTTAIVMISEVLFAAGSAAAFGGAAVTLPLALGGALIVAAAALTAIAPARATGAAAVAAGAAGAAR